MRNYINTTIHSHGIHPQSPGLSVAQPLARSVFSYAFIHSLQLLNSLQQLNTACRR